MIFTKGCSLCLLVVVVVVVMQVEGQVKRDTVGERFQEARNEVADKMKEFGGKVDDGMQDVKEELDRAVENLNNSPHSEDHGSPILGTDACGSSDCNNRGTCIGTKKAFICACNIGFSGKDCQETICDSTRDCNGRGLCIGTTNSLTCLCNLGFTGKRCESVV